MDRTPALISSNLSSDSQIDKIITLYTAVTNAYTESIKQTTGTEYNQMIKKPVDYQVFANNRNILSRVL